MTQIIITKNDEGNWDIQFDQPHETIVVDGPNVWVDCIDNDDVANTIATVVDWLSVNSD